MKQWYIIKLKYLGKKIVVHKLVFSVSLTIHIEAVTCDGYLCNFGAEKQLIRMGVSGMQTECDAGKQVRHWELQASSLCT
jgi:hypothetical protein